MSNEAAASAALFDRTALAARLKARQAALMAGGRHYSFHEAEPTPQTLAIYNTQLARWRKRFPQMFTAPQPELLPQVSGKFRLDMQSQFPDIAANFHFREPESTDLIQLTAIGICLAPLLQQPDAFMLDTTMRPQDGDVVSVLVTPEIHAHFCEQSRDHPAYRALYGGTPGPIVAKLLVALGGHYYLATNRSAFPFEGCQTLGVVVAVKPGAGGGHGVSCRAAAE